MVIECSESSDDCSGCDKECVVEVMGEEHMIGILDAVASGGGSAREIAAAAEVPKTTLYRRLETLVDAGFIVEELHPREDGHHFSTYRPALERFAVTRTEDGISVDISYRDDVDGDGPDEPVIADSSTF